MAPVTIRLFAMWAAAKATSAGIPAIRVTWVRSLRSGIARRLIPPSPIYVVIAISSINACDDTFNTTLMGARRVHNSPTVLTATTHATLGQVGTTTAAAKYGMKPMEPVADRGSKKLSSSAVMASAHRINASVTIERDTAGDLKTRPDVQAVASKA